MENNGWREGKEEKKDEDKGGDERKGENKRVLMTIKFSNSMIRSLKKRKRRGVEIKKERSEGQEMEVYGMKERGRRRKWGRIKKERNKKWVMGGAEHCAEGRMKAR